MPKVSAGLLCPMCDAEGKEYELYQITPATLMQCESGNPLHKWNDTGVLKAMNPRRLSARPQPQTPQPNHVPVTLSVAPRTADALKAKFGDRLAVSLGSVLAACSEPRMTILGGQDLERLEEKLGPGLNTAAELFGRVFALVEEKKAAVTELERLMRKMNVKRGSDAIELELGDFEGKAMRMAAESNRDISEFLSDYVRNSLENDWITVS